MQSNKLIIPDMIVSASARSVMSETSCTSTISIMAEQTAKPELSKPRRRVQFCEDDNEYYTNIQMNEDECRELWFSAEELQMFKQSTACLARKVLRSPIRDTQAWVNSLLYAYADLSEASTVDDLQNILENTEVPSVSSALWGLEKWILRPVVHDKMARRARMLDIINECQENTTSSQSTKNKLLRKASRDLSRPSRLFAHHVAVMAYHSDK